MSRKKFTIQLLVVLGLLAIIGFTYLGYNYDNYLSWLSVKKNITAMCFGVIALMYVLIIFLRYQWNKETDLRHYYSNKSEDYRRKYYAVNSKKVELQEKYEDLLVQNGILKGTSKIKK